METPLRRGPAEVHIQSRECDPQILERFTGASFFPERLLGWAVIETAARGAGTLLYITAPPVEDPAEQIDYYLGLLGPGHTAARDRVRLVGVDDTGPRWLSEKVLDPDNPGAAQVRDTIREFLDHHRRAGDAVRLDYFEPSAPLERFARELGVAGNQPDSSCIPLGTKQSGRRLFTEAGIPVPAGTGELCHSLADIAAQVAELAGAGHRTVMVKLDDAANGAGLGNALLDLDALEVPPRDILTALPRATLVDSTITWDDYVRAVEKNGALVEEWIRDDSLRSPSFQGRITDAGVVAVATHDQVLGGHDQSYTGCRFPAAAEYRPTLLDYGLRVGRALREHGVGPGDYAVDFLARRTGTRPAGARSAGASRAGAGASRTGTGWQLLGCEINLRSTGTRHAFGLASAVLGTRATPDGRLLVDGHERVYECSDAVIDPRYKGLRPAQLIRAVTASPLGYDPARATGVVLHTLSAATHHGKFGAVCVGTDRAEASALLRGLRELVDGLAEGRAGR